MNLLSSFFGRKSPVDVEKVIVVLSPGEYSIVRSKDSPKGHRELIYKEAEISLVQTTREFYINLQIKDLNNQDEEDDEFGELASEADKSFLIHKDLQLHLSLKNGRTAITWRELEGDKGDRFEFLCAPTVSRDSLNKFNLVVCEGLYGQEHGSIKNVSEEQLLEYTTIETPDVSDRPTIVKKEPSGGISAGRVILNEKADFCYYDKDNRCFVSSDENNDCDIVLLDAGDYKYILEARKNGKSLVSEFVTVDLNFFIDLSNIAFIFNTHNAENPEVEESYLFKFHEMKSLEELNHEVSIAKYESREHKKIGDLEQADQDFMVKAMSNMNLNDEVDNKEYEEYEDSEEEQDDVDDTEAYGDETGKSRSGINSTLEVGHTNDRTFVVNGNRIGVFKNLQNELEYSTTIQGLDFDPSKIMLHEQDRALILQNDTNKKSLYKMDLETGKVVEEWNTGKEVVDFNPINKFAQTTAEQNLFGVASQSMFRIDPRISGGKVMPSSSKTYKTKNLGLSHIVTTEAGWIVVGNNKGEIRLFNKLGDSATTVIPGPADPIVGLDVSADGKFVLVTYKRQLLLVETVDKANNGFTSKWLKESRPTPRKLMISPQNVVYMQQRTHKPISFTAAKFNVSPTSKETTIVTSTGPFLVTWNLGQILKGISDSYRIKVYDTDITAKNFKYGTDQRVILSLTDNVNIVSKSALKKPSDVFKSSNNIKKI